ncbi:MAG: alpha/beta hydrolase-fold protein [Bacteroidales bacterium]
MIKLRALNVLLLAVLMASCCNNNNCCNENDFIQVDTVAVYSPKMNRDIKNTIILPEQYACGEDSYPVIFLLNGYDGDYKAWLGTKPNLDKLASENEVIFVLPDGQDSWYIDSPIDSTMQFETYLTKELLPYVDNNYRTKATAEYRAITGLSMGGHGALHTAIKHPNLFKNAGSMSGGVNIAPYTSKWKLQTLLGDTIQYKEEWYNSNVTNLAKELENGVLNITIDCGVDDFFFDINNNLHQLLVDNKVDHDYTVRPGGHSHPYWRNSIDYHILFFTKQFAKANEESK